jgi:hypothetical protein
VSRTMLETHATQSFRRRSARVAAPLRVPAATSRFRAP